MACPIAPVLVLGAVAGGGHTLFVQDRSHRLTSWLATLGLVLGWAAYVALYRQPPLRIALESLSVAALVAGGARVWWLLRTGGVRSPMWTGLQRAGRYLVAVFGGRGVLAAKFWLLAMLTMQWRGKAHFSGIEYTIVTGIVLALAAVRIVRLTREHRRRPASFAALESFAPDAPPSACPLGFGCDPLRGTGGASPPQTGDAE